MAFRRAIIILACMAYAGVAAAAVALDSDVKAAYLSKMGLFVEWPASAFASPTSPVALCVVGDNPFGDTLNNLVEGQRVGNRALVVRYVKSVAARSGCGIVYIDRSEMPSAPAILAALNGESVLTVTDGASDDRASGIVNFVSKDNRVRFVIDQRAALRCGLTISSHLLGLALAVKSGA